MPGQRVVLLSAGLFVPSWFVTAANSSAEIAGGPAAGWQAFLFALQPLFDADIGGSVPLRVWMVTSALSNVVLVLALGLMLWRPSPLHRALPRMLVVATLINAYWFLLPDIRGELRIGYYLWLAAFAVGAWAAHAARRTTMVAVVAVVAMTLVRPDGSAMAAARCSLAPAPTMALLRVERDTTLPFGDAPQTAFSSSGVASGTYESQLATPGTPMPAARVRLLAMDSATRTLLSASGLTDSAPTIFMRAAPYGPDCRTLRWTDSIPFAITGEVGYVRGTLAPRSAWIGDVPVLVVADAWNYPYPRRRPYGMDPATPLAPAEAMYALQLLLDRPLLRSPQSPAYRDSVAAARVPKIIAWARRNAETAELEPIRTLVRQTVLEEDWREAQRAPSRLRGTYRVDLDTDGAQHTWYFRTQPQLAYQWLDTTAQRTTAQVLASPHIPGYRLVGFAADSLRALPRELNARGSAAERPALVWLTTNDRPTAPGNEARTTLSASLEFMLGAAPEAAWTVLDAWVPALSARDSLMMSRLPVVRPRREVQARVPLSVRIARDGGIRADTSLTRNGRALRLRLTRVDTVTATRTF